MKYRKREFLRDVAGIEYVLKSYAFRVFATICEMKDAGERVTLRTLMDKLDESSIQGMRNQLDTLRNKGFIDFQDGKMGTVSLKRRIELFRPTSQDSK